MLSFINYEDLITKNTLNPLSATTQGENHHILPKCLGGTDEKSNIVRLSHVDHIWAHIWLAECFPNEAGLQVAVCMMVFGDNKQLGRVPTAEQIVASANARKRSQDFKRSFVGPKNHNYGKPMTEEQKRKISIAKKGTTLPPRSSEYCRNVSIRQTGKNNHRYGKKASPETRAKMSLARKGRKNPNYGKTASKETREKISKASPYHGISPWRHSNTRTKPHCLALWVNAQKYYLTWKETGCAYKKLATIHGDQYRQTHKNMVLRFRKGWVPNQDEDWVKFTKEKPPSK